MNIFVETVIHEIFHDSLVNRSSLVISRPPLNERWGLNYWATGNGIRPEWFSPLTRSRYLHLKVASSEISIITLAAVWTLERDVTYFGRVLW